MKYKSIARPDVLIEAFQWDPKKPASTRPEWFNKLVNTGEVVHESNDSVSLPFPAMRSAHPGEFIVLQPNDQVVATVSLHGWEPVTE